mgnify:FL=1
MKHFLPTCVLFAWCCVGAFCQLTCNKCEESWSGRGYCGTEQKCTSVETRCLAIRWGTNQIAKKSNSYDTRCATADECSDYGRDQLCSGKDCEAKCCQTSKCNPFGHDQVNIIQTEERTFHCYECSRDSLDSCTSTDQKCDDDQDACISFLMEGGNFNKVYTKRCARKNECTPSELDRLCALEKDQSNRKECRASCCFDEMCNQCALNTVSMLVMATTLLFAMFY